jgi:23S rRNA pseudouridine2605 synthase
MKAFDKRRSSGPKSGAGEGSTDKSGKKGYKASRSFSKNKASRSDGPKKSYDKKEGGDRGRFRKSDSDRDFKPKRSFGDKPERAKRSSDDKPAIERRVFNKDERSEKKYSGDRAERPRRSFGDKPERGARSFDDSKPRGPKRDSTDGDRPRRSFGDKPERGARSFDDSKPRAPKREFGSGEKRERRSFGDKPERGARSFDETKSRTPKRESADGEKRERRSFDDSKPRAPKRDFGGKERGERTFGAKPAGRGSFEKREERGERPERSDSTEGSQRRSKRSFTTERRPNEDFETSKSMDSSGVKERPKKSAPKPAKSGSEDGLIRLNKYLSNAGIASRREADVLIQSGVVKVNGVPVDQLGYKIKPGDKVTYGDAAVKTERKVYMLVNKPKDYITTVEDERERKTVMELIEGACKERVYPVGRLDRNTTGVLLLTNDGELTTKLTHPKFGVKKVYNVSLNKGLRADDFKKIIEGVELEDGLINVDDLAFVGEGKKEIGLEIHSGRNRIVRRIFEHLGYEVLKLDRVVFAGLTKKDLPRGKYRFLTAKEISFLKMIG